MYIRKCYLILIFHSDRKENDKADFFMHSLLCWSIAKDKALPSDVQLLSDNVSASMVRFDEELKTTVDMSVNKGPQMAHHSLS